MYISGTAFVSLSTTAVPEKVYTCQLGGTLYQLNLVFKAFFFLLIQTRKSGRKRKSWVCVVACLHNDDRRPSARTHTRGWPRPKAKEVALLHTLTNLSTKEKPGQSCVVLASHL
jgi:hypothetical protein